MIHVIDPHEGVRIVSVFDRGDVNPYFPTEKRVLDHPWEFDYFLEYESTDSFILGRSPVQEIHPAVKNMLEQQSFFNNALALFDDWNFGKAANYDDSNFNAVEHVSIRGSDLHIGLYQADIDFDQELWLADAVLVEGEQPLFQLQERVVTEPEYVSTYSELAEYLSTGTGIGGDLSYYDPSAMIGSDIMDYKAVVTSTYASYRFGRYIRWYNGLGRHRADVYGIVIKPRPLPTFPVSGDMATIGLHCDVFVYQETLANWYPGNMNDHYSGSSYQTTVRSKQPTDTGWSGATQVRMYTPVIAFSRSQVPGTAARLIAGEDLGFNNPSFPVFNQVVSRAQPDIAPTVFLAAQDAVSSAINNTGVNGLEHLAEISDVFGLVSLKDLIRSLPEIARVRPGKLLWSILDVLADARLVYSFALAPSADDIQMIASEAKLVRSAAIGLLNGSQSISYGSATVFLEDYFPEFNDAKLTARAKISYNPEPDSLLVSLLPLSSVGLYPDLSTIWNVLPFSFIFDYYFNVGSLLEAVDSTRQLTVLNVKQSEVSTTVRWDFSQEFLTLLGAVQSGHDTEPVTSHFRAYHRFAMRKFPALLPSSIVSEHLSTGGDPNWLTSGALFYKLGSS